MLEAEPRMLRPANIAAKAPGRGVTTVETAGPGERRSTSWGRSS